MSLGLAAVAAAAVTASGRGIELWQWPFLQASNLPRSLVWANLYIAVLNFMPAYPLDGGRIVRALFSRTLDPSSATGRDVFINTAIAMVLILAGLFSDSWLTMVGVIVFSAAQLEERALVFQSVLEQRTPGRSDAHRLRHALPRRYLSKTRSRKPSTRCRMISRSFAAAIWWA